MSVDSLKQIITDYMKKNLSTYQVTVITKSANTLNSLGSSILKVMIDEFSSVVIDSEAILSATDSTLSTKLWNQTADQSNLKIGIIEVNDRTNRDLELQKMLESFMKYSKLDRGKSIILLTNGILGLISPGFFRLAWLQDFLDLTIVECIDITPKYALRRLSKQEYLVKVHTFNPFRSEYSIDSLTEKTDILPDKLRDLHKYPLHVNAGEKLGAFKPNEYLMEKKFDYLRYDDNIFRMNILADTMNFFPIPVFESVDTSENFPNSKRIFLEASLKQWISSSLHESKWKLEPAKSIIGIDDGEKTSHSVIENKTSFRGRSFAAISQIKGMGIPRSVWKNVFYNDKLLFTVDTNQKLIDFNLYPDKCCVMNEFDDITLYIEQIKNFSSSIAHIPVLKEIRLSVTQRKVVKTNVSSYNFLIICIALVVMELIIFLSSRFLKLDKNVWSVTKIAHLLLGGSMTSQQRMSLRGKILLISVYFASIIMMVLTGDELLKMMLTSKKILRFKTLKELADSGLSLHVLNATKVDLLRYGQYNSHVQKIADRSITVESANDFRVMISQDVIGGLIYGELVQPRKSPESPDVLSTDGIVFDTIIDDIIETEIYFIHSRINSPYKDRFEPILLKLRESGLLHDYFETFLYHSIRSWFRESATRSSASYSRHGEDNDEDVDIPLNFKLKIIIMTGYFLSCVALVWEIFIKNLNRRRYKSHLKRVRTRIILSN
ncbi:hypothetical protein QAD02_010933 [Eretmocerus hayati]|uniref:Uncharacterized protein n=1 Tax=Eretmocerus hayati TaxID=131215 RepID=A0ACC2NY68_9HYME|nr:hypothetical protein QAD02_010933 [Eretmocerus hayati]